MTASMTLNCRVQRIHRTRRRGLNVKTHLWAQTAPNNHRWCCLDGTDHFVATKPWSKFGDLGWERDTRGEIHRQWCNCALLRDAWKSHIRRNDVFWHHIDTVGVNSLSEDVEVFVAIYVHLLQTVVMVLHETGHDNQGTTVSPVELVLAQCRLSEPSGSEVNWGQMHQKVWFEFIWNELINSELKQTNAISN